MEKMDMMSMDRVQENIAKIRALFPECVTEVMRDGKVTLAVDFDELKQEMSGMLIDEREERYQMTWPDKRKAKLLANTSISATLRPCKEESVDFDNTQNLYIEGDNLDVLKLLQETYLGKVKMIYIDPPYNTGSDFVYEDDFAQSAEEYVANSGQYDDQGNRLVENKETNGRFHTDWLNMIYPRLMVARDLLTDDGVIFISCDDHEQANLKNVCDEVFGASNFIAIINWKGRSGRQDSKYYAAVHEYIYCYAKHREEFSAGEEIKSGDVFPKYDEEKKRFYKTQLLRKWGSNSKREDRPNLYYPIIAPDGTKVYPTITIRDAQRPSICRKIDGRWRHGASTMEKNIKEGLVEFVKQKDGSWIPYEKIFAPYEGEEKTKKYSTWIEETNDGAKEIKELFGIAVFDYPKNPSLLARFLKMAKIEGSDTILDFFSGSATTAHAVMQLNAEDGGHRKFIMVQLPEKCDEKSEAYKAGYKNICEIGKERIRRAGKIIKENINALRPVVDEITDYEKETGQIRVAHTWGNGITGRTNYAANATETFIDAKTGQRITHEYEETDPKDHYRFHPEDLDVGFRVLKLDSSNMKDVYYKAEDYAQTMIAGLEDNVKEDRTPLDLLFQVMLDLGQELSAKIEEKTIAGKTVWCVEGNNIIACFDSYINDQVVTEIAKLKPLYAVFRDSSFVSDAAAANCEQIFASISPETSRRVI